MRLYDKLRKNIARSIKTMREDWSAAGVENMKRRIILEAQKKYYFSGCDITISEIDNAKNTISFNVVGPNELNLWKVVPSQIITKENQSDFFRDLRTQFLGQARSYYPCTITLTPEAGYFDGKEIRDIRQQDMAESLRKSVDDVVPSLGSRLVNYSMIWARCACGG